MSQYLSVSDLKDLAKEKLTGKFGNAVLVELSYNMILFSITFAISSIISGITTFTVLASSGNIAGYELSFNAATLLNVLQYILTLLCSIFGGIFNTGICLYFLNIASGRQALLSNMFYGFQYLFKKSLALSAVMALWNAICLLPYNICYFIFGQTRSNQWAIYMVICMIIGMIIYVPVSLSISQSFFLLLDFPSRSAKELLQQSIRLMKGKKKKLFLLQISFLPLMLLGVLTFGLGNLWINPYMNMTLALYFLDIMKPTTTE